MLPRRAEGVHVNMTAVRSHFKPDIVRVREGEQVHVHLTNVEQAKDATHGFAIGSHNVNVSIEPGEHANISFVARRSGGRARRPVRSSGRPRSVTPSASAATSSGKRSEKPRA